MARKQDEKRNPPLEEQPEIMRAALRRERDQISRWPKPDTERIREIDTQLKANGDDLKGLEPPRGATPGGGMRTTQQR